ncbi:MAG: DUF1926 domain-containing protein [Candidatus Coatesbacteria bacterium]|nr:DUF1926 domain-containing protein [Candidatus Coatesbacteria bacterium]
MNKIYFILGVHNHQPVGNFGFIFEKALKEAYIPFTEELLKHDDIKFVVHTSGCLWDYIKNSNSEYMDLIKEGTKKSQIELIGSGYQEPLLPVIPERDAYGQLDKMRDFMHENFGLQMNGCWLTERVWEPNLAKILFNARIKYTFLDDYHFLTAGIKKRELYKSFITEYNGFPVIIFPISEKLRYLIPFSELDELKKYLVSISEEGEDNLLVLIDDGEKFGLWPGTYDWVYNKEYLKRLIVFLEDNNDWIETILPGEYTKKIPAENTVYFPTTAYREMGEWSLRAEKSAVYKKLWNSLDKDIALPFVRGGYWRNFLEKYPESNYLYRRMLKESDALAKAEHEKLLPEKDLQEARNYLYKSQCNCAYWHGVFGGLYLNYLRNSIYENLLQIDNILCKKVDFSIKTDEEDSLQRLIYGIGKISRFTINPRGSSFMELSFYPCRFNMLDTVSRKYEAYHEHLKHSDFNGVNSDHASIHDSVVNNTYKRFEELIFDSELRYSNIDYLFRDDFHYSDFEENSQFFKSSSLSKNLYEYLIKDRRIEFQTLADMDRKIIIKKNISIEEDMVSLSTRIKIDLLIDGLGNLEKPGFASLWNLTLLADNADDRYFILPYDGERHYNMNYKGSWQRQGILILKDDYMKMLLFFTFKKPCQIWSMPIYTISLSESGIEETYQGTAFLFIWNDLPKTDIFENTIELLIKKEDV